MVTPARATVSTRAANPSLRDKNNQGRPGSEAPDEDGDSEVLAAREDAGRKDSATFSTSLAQRKPTLKLRNPGRLLYREERFRLPPSLYQLAPRITFATPEA